MRQIIVILSLASFLTTAAQLRAQVPIGGEFLISDVSHSSAVLAHGKAVAMAPGGAFVVVWESITYPGASSDVMGQRFDSAGQRVGAQFLVNTTTTDNQRNATVAMDGAGRFVVVWRGRADFVNYDIYGQRYEADGSRLGSEFRVNTYTTGNHAYNEVAAEPGGAFIVVWSGPGPGDTSGVHGQRYNSDGTPAGSQFQINSYTTNSQFESSIALDAAGNAVVVWMSPQIANSAEVYGQRFSATGSRLGAEFRVNSFTTGNQRRPTVSVAPMGAFLVAWESAGQDGSFGGIFGQRYEASGVPEGPEFRVNTYTTGFQREPTIAVNAAGDFVVVWDSDGQDGHGFGIVARGFDASGIPRGPDWVVNTYTTQGQIVPSAAADARGNVVVAWTDASNWLVKGQRLGQHVMPVAMELDTSGNGVLEPGETVDVRPAWRNTSSSAQVLTGTLANIAGPPGATYAITDGMADYGAIPATTDGTCIDCYELSVSDPPQRPALHWDLIAEEIVSPIVTEVAWRLHVGRTFDDVPPTSAFYASIETLVHQGVTVGCSHSDRRTDYYCPDRTITRAEVTPFLLMAREGAAYAPPPCVPPGMFGDVPVTSPFCPWIEELARRGAVDECARGRYCPHQGARREEVAVFLLRTLDPAINPPACVPPNMFSDVPETSPYCPWIEDLANRGGSVGCGGGNFCPEEKVTREQMASFITVVFALTLYGP